MRSIDAFREIVAGEREGPPVAKLLGMRMVAVEEGRVTFELDAGPQHTSPLGTVHGGIVCDIADAAMGCAHASLLADGETFTMLHLKSIFVKPLWQGLLTAVGSVLKSGRSIGLSECR